MQRVVEMPETFEEALSLGTEITLPSERLVTSGG